MEGIADAIKYLYQQWILRDIVAYVTPGTIVATCLLWVFLEDHVVLAFVRDLPAIAYVPIYGLLFTTGVGIQNFGEFIRVLREHQECVELQKYKGEWRRFADLRQFHEVLRNEHEYGDEMERTRERIEVKKYASGNIALAVSISLMLISVTTTFPRSGRWAAGFVLVLLTASLFYAHRKELRYLAIWQHEVLEAAGDARLHAKPPAPGETTATADNQVELFDRESGRLLLRWKVE